MPTNKNFSYVSDYAVIIISAEKVEDAEEILKEIVKEPDIFELDNVSEIV